MRTRTRWALIATIGLLLIAGAVFAWYAVPRSTPHIPPAQLATPDQTALSPSARFDHIFVLVEENKPYGAILGNPAAPYITTLAQHYAVATNYYAVAHPSLPNYIALTSGSTYGYTSDCNPPGAGCIVSARNIGDVLESHGMSWKAYVEGMPTACYAMNAGRYATKHNPFVYYNDIVNNKERCAQHVVPFAQLAVDVQHTESTPQYAFIVPDLCHDMHDCSVETGDAWLQNLVPSLLRSPAFTTQRSLLMITWDEDDGGGNHVATILVGPHVKPGYTLTGTYNHYSLLKTVEANWGLPALTVNDEKVAPMGNFIQ
ncbi:MAG TPA: alkaline phosphatase family protein [Candidatus Saccharimonadales bacterium]|nr:alkaline phosphatase family protein [Candidatus Saccharimonadales bacterium]